MSQNVLKDLFNQKRYNDVIDNLKILYKDLYIQMLDYRKSEMEIEEDYEQMEYFQLSPIIRKYYPQFSDNITLLNVSSANPNESYLDIINTLLSTYLYFKENYKLDYDKEKYRDVDVENLTFNDELDEEEEYYNRLYNEVHKDDNVEDSKDEE